MNLFQAIQHAARERGLSFVVIGGLAVIEHGYPRTTTDLDLLVLTDAKVRWHDLMVSLGYRLVREQETFRQYEADAPELLDVDLMFVKRPTIEGIMAVARRVSLEGVELPFASLEHLLMLKLHVLKYSHIRRFLKDFNDVIHLVEINKIDLRSPAVRDLFLKYGNTDLYEKICRACEPE